ncbi:hypothetical protein AK830_g7915 [Neonectria ditissima]|uniref:Crh-like protein n=1 Tax=Neonectria ditissima TaxID=78410 RepID=A0A0P7BF80_9HYPO|nr:hypothetical protein AK830_g7915 [Neonectria ditissima]
MFNKIVSTAVVSLAALQAVSAQTFTDCNPLKKTCPPNPALGKEKVSCGLTKSACSALETLPGTEIKYDSKGAHFTIEKETNAPTVASKKFIFFGRVDVEVQAAEGQGIVTSIVLQSDDLDEIDWEWLGGDTQQVQTNYFSKGDTTVYDRGGFHDVSDPLTTYHKYSIEWTKDAVNWLIDDNNVRTLKASSVKGFPETPMQVKLGTWCAGGKDTPKGTVDWAGGYTDFSKAPFNAYYKSLSIVDYAGGDSATSKSVKEYVWSDNSGDWESIEVKTGTGSDDDSEDTETTSAADKATTKTAPASGAKTQTQSTKDESESQDASTAAVSPSASDNATSTPVETSSADNTSVPSTATHGTAQSGLVAAALLLAYLFAFM